MRACLLIAVWLLPGCLQGGARQSNKPALLPSADDIRGKLAQWRLNEKPGPDPFAVRLEVQPLESFGAPGSRLLVIATVRDAEGQPRRQKRIEWSLEGVGKIDAVDTASYLSMLDTKPQPKFAVSYTAGLPHTVKGEAGQDIAIGAGQTWCVLNSEVEGDARLTVHCPEIASPPARELFVVRRWADVAWNVPATIAVPVGASPVIATPVVRASDRQPASNYRVRYRWLDGPPVIFAASRLPETEVTPANGEARAMIIEPTPRPGRNRIAVELVRAGTSDDEAVVVARGESAVEWQAPQVELKLQAPHSAAAGQQVPVTMTLRNAGQIPTPPLELRLPAPAGALFVRSEPPARDGGGQLLWTFPALPPGASQNVVATFECRTPAVVPFAASVQGKDGLAVTQRTTTRFAHAELVTVLDAPPTAAPGEAVTYDATVTNGGNGPAQNVVLQAYYDEGLEHTSQAHPLEFKLGAIEPGKSRSVPLTLTPQRTGVFRVRLTASADGNLRGEALHTLSVAGKLMNVSIVGPATRYVDRTGNWDVQVTNPGTVPMTNVVLRVQLPAEIECRSASDKAQFSARQAVWTVGNLAAGESKSFQLTAAAIRTASRAELTATATADGISERKSTAALEILGVPAIRVEIGTPGATASLKSKLVYRVIVRNAGSLAARNIAVAAELSPNVRPIAATGPTIGRVDGPRVAFDRLERLDPQQAVTFLIEAEARQLGDGRLRVSVGRDHASEPELVEEAIQIVPAAR